MLLIPCPVVRRRATRSNSPTAAMRRCSVRRPTRRWRNGSTTSICATIRRGPHRRALASQRRLPPAGSRCGATRAPTRSSAARPQPARAGCPESERDLTQTGLPPGREAASIDRSRPLVVRVRRHALRRATRATRSPPRCSPTACSFVGAQLQVPPPARHLRRRDRGAERAGAARARCAHRAQRARDHGRAVRRARRARARTAGRRCAFDFGAITGVLSRVPAGRLLLQDLHVAADAQWWLCYEHFIRRAAGMGTRADRDAIPTATSISMPIATCW